MAKRLLIGGLMGMLLWMFWPAPAAIPVDSDGEWVDALPFESTLSLTHPPLQRPLAPGVGRFIAEDFHISPQADFQLEARILGRKIYHFDDAAKLSPFDLALGWGPMARDEVLEHISIRQANRFYYWSTPAFPIPRRDIERNSANMHLIPASAEVTQVLNRARTDDRIRLRGYLVHVDRDDGWRWRTSLTRDDVGGGACEIVLVTEALLCTNRQPQASCL